MRIAPLVFSVSVLSLALQPALANGAQVAELEQKIQAKQSEFDSYVSNLEQIRKSISLDEDELTRLKQQSADVEKARKAALLAMDKQYERLVANPILDISEAKDAYLYALNTQKLNKKKIKQQKATVTNSKDQLANSKMVRFGLLNQLENLKEQHSFARVERLRKEFQQGGKMEVSQSIACGGDVTFKQCAEQGNSLARKTATQMFTNNLVKGITEQVSSSNLTSAASGVKVVKQDILDSGFSGQGDYQVKLMVEMKGYLPNVQACRLLGLDYRYCAGGGEDFNVADFKESDAPANLNEPLSYLLTVRSNLFDDEVFIDGVSYGASKVEIMLPSGIHDVVVSKPGFQKYSAKVDLSRNKVIRAQLNRMVINLNTGDKFNDALANDLKGPALIAIEGGSYRVGDIQGKGLGNEISPAKVKIANTYGIGATTVTHAQFDAFVEATGYRTTAEKGEGCAIYTNGAPEFDKSLSWRNPGFEQANNSPVVCVSRTDAKTYTKWLSRISGYQYRLPSEKEWEIAARAGTTSDYWWGNKIGSGKANCGWCGTRWSNEGTSPVSSFKANKFGLYDTVGNVWELTSGERNIVRGGAWNFAPSLARVSSRLEISNSFKSNYIGFRVLREQ